jgi:transposase
MVLADFARQALPGPHKQIAVVLDRAGWHTSPEVQIPDDMHLIFLPPYSPELQPAERLWPLTNEAIANRSWPDLETLEAAQSARCLTLQAAPATIRRYTCNHWWPGASS